MSKFAKKNTTGNDALLMWANRVCKPKGIELKNIIKDWLDGLAFCDIINFVSFFFLKLNLTSKV